MASGDVVWEKVPSYRELIKGVYDYVFYVLRQEGENGTLSRGTLNDLRNYFHFDFTDIVIVLLLAVVLTVIRHLATEWLFKPLGYRFALTPWNQQKMPESAWKFLYYLSAWSFNLYVVVFKGSYYFFQKPSTVWDGWRPDLPIQTDIYVLYMVQCSFYVHSVYATAFQDTWRKDSFVMMIHHFLTLGLISISYALRYHNIGTLVLLLHDTCDVQLEFTKLNVYFKVQGGRLIRIHEYVANFMFCLFASTWFLSRLYWYPLKVLYTTSAVVEMNHLDLPLGLLVNFLLWVLQALNIYWFLFILGFLLRVATGQIREVDDTREYDVDEKFRQSQRSSGLSVRSKPLQNGNISSNGQAPVSHEPSPSLANGSGDVNLRIRSKSGFR